MGVLISHGVTAIVDNLALERLVQGRAALDQRLAGGAIIYGKFTTSHSRKVIFVPC